MADEKTHEWIAPPPGEFGGHPRGLWMLFGSEFWERFCYYGMRAILAVHVAQAFFAHHGDGAESEASLTYGGYTSMVYMTGLLGGYVADRILGYQRSIMLGGSMMAAGMFMLLAPDLPSFLVGLALLVVGNGLFKPNISTMVGQLYAPGDSRRDSGFTIFYMGINAGALIAPLITSTWIGVTYGLKWGFFAAGIGMIFGLMVFQLLKSWIGHVGKPPKGKEGYASVGLVLVGGLVLAAPVYVLLSKSEILGYILGGLLLFLTGYFVRSGLKASKVQLHRYLAMLILFIANAIFWALFEQAGSSLNFFARDFVDLTVAGYTVDFAAFQSANPTFILLLAPLFALAWPALDKKKMNPSIPRKFAIALVLVALGFYVLVFSIGQMRGEDGKIPAFMLALCYLIHTSGELCLSPIGLSMVTKLAKPEETGLAMGGWFLSIAGANYIAGLIASVATGGGAHGAAAGSIEGYSTVFNQLFIMGLVLSIVFFIAAPFINKLMHGVK